MQIYTIQAHKINLGKGFSRGRITGLSKFERDTIRSGDETVVLLGCDPYHGCTTRVVVELNGKFYTRMPTQDVLDTLTMIGDN
jgi:hypothetical protein